MHLLPSLLATAAARETGITFVHAADREERLSYRELYEQALCVLGALQARGLRPGDELVIQVESNRSFLLLFWGCLLGGIIPVPLSPGIGTEQKTKLFRVWQYLSNPYLACDVAQAATLHGLSAGEARPEAVEAVEAVLARRLPVPELLAGCEPGTAAPAAAGDLAYVQFSSGSTGDPKGVRLTHANLASNIADITASLGITGADRLLSWMPLTHDMGLIGFHLTALAGGLDACCIPTALFIRRPLVWMEKTAAHGATVLYSPNFGLQYFLSSYEPDRDYGWDLSRVRVIVNGAEAISANLCAEFTAALGRYGLPPRSIVAAYGLAEASVEVSATTPGTEITRYYLHRDALGVGQEVKTGGMHDDGVACFVGVGRVVSACRLRICDDRDAPLGENTIGHLQIRGGNVTAGYYNNAPATERLFTADGWLKTGDLGFVRAGCLVITGRWKNIILLNGYTYYPQDVEGVLVAEGIAELGKVVAVGARDPRQDGEELVVFVLFKGDRAAFMPTVRAVGRALAAALGIAAPKVIPVRKIPKTTSGKIQHHLLLDAYRAGAYDEYLRYAAGAEGPAATPPTAPGGPGTRAQLLGMANALLGRTDVQAHTNLFESGLNSLTATRLANRLSALRGAYVSPQVVFAHCTVAALEAYLAGAGRAGDLPEVDEAAPAAGLSAAQRRMWVEYQLNKGSSAYHVPLLLTVTGPLDVARLEAALRRVIGKYEILRTSFPLAGDEPVQRVHDYDEALFTLGYADLRDACARPNGERRAIREAIAAPFALDAPTQLRAAVLHTRDGAYRLVFVVHHLLVDGWSLALLFAEIARYYNQPGSGDAPAAVPYRAYAAWQRQLLASGRLAASREYWQEELAGLPEQPVDFAEKPDLDPSLTPECWKYRHLFPPAQTALLRQLAARHDTTPFVVLMALLNVLLYRYTNRKDITVGFDVTGRVLPWMEPMIGYTLNTLCLRVALTGDHTFAGVVAGVKAKVARASDHQLYPFEQVLADRHRGRAPGGNDLFSILVLYQNFLRHDAMPGFAGCTVQRENVNVPEGMVDLLLEFTEHGHGLELWVHYNEKRYGARTIAHFTEHLANLLGRVAGDDGQAVGTYDFLTDAEKAVVLPAPADLRRPARTPVHLLFESRAAATPDAVAVGGCRLTYRALNERANAVAHRLRAEHGVGPGHRVGFRTGRDEKLVVALLAILKAGAAYVALDPELPVPRCAEIAADCEMTCVLTDGTTAGSLRGHAAFPPHRLVDLDAPAGGSGRTDNPVYAGAPDDLAYVIYTSGSTGRPKGVMIGHQSLAHYVAQFTACFGVDAGDVVVQQASPAFDTVVEEIFPALCASARVVIAPRGGKDVEGLLALIAAERATVLSTTPLVLREINATADDRLASLRLVVSGGDVLHAAHVDRLLERLPVYNSYGPSETTVCATYGAVSPRAATPSLGRPIPGYWVYILDENQQVLPVGKAGELFIRGGLARGYLNEEALTAEKFVPSPFHPGEKLFRSGDVGRWNERGEIEFAGRNDLQVKVRGHRVEVAEVEKWLCAFPAVENGVAVQPPGADYLVACLQAGPGFSEDALRDYLGRHLPAYMVPSRCVLVETLPRTATGKADRQALRERAAAGPAPRPDPPLEGELEQTLGRLWEDVLGTPVRGSGGNFFEMGGHSIKAYQLQTRIQGALGVEVKLSELFRHPTIGQQGRLIREIERAAYQYIDIL